MFQRLILLAILPLAFEMAGQDFRASLRGRVTDSSGATLTNAQIIVTNLDNSVPTKTETTNTGDFRVEAPGFNTHVQDGITPGIQDRPTVYIQLTAGANHYNSNDLR